jgi:iron complex outermembrane receptor protein
VGADGLVTADPISVTHDFSHVLPSLNLALQIDDSQTVRFGIAETISRPRMDEMNANVQINYNQQPDANGNNWSVSGGNPRLEPKEALGIDLTYENYFSQEGYFSIAYFYKDLKNWIFDGQYELDLAGVADPQTGLIPANSGATGSGKINEGGGELSGYEIALTMPLTEFDESLEGFGFIISHTGLDSDIKIPGTDNEFQLPGLSDTIQTFTMYYDLDGFSARASMRKRDDFKGDVYGLGFNTDQVDIIGETIWDAQLAYDFGQAGHEGWLEGLSVFVQGQNLTNEPFTSYYNGDPLQVRDYQNYGRYYLLGFSYKL